MHNAELHVFNFRDLPHAFIRVGKRTFVGESVIVRGQGGVEIGDDVLIAPRAQILAINHNYADVSRPIIDQGITGRGIVIEDGSWIGAGAIVLDGVRVGRGAVVGANAVVTRDVPPHTVVVGSPARVVKRLDRRAIATSPARCSRPSGRGAQRGRRLAVGRKAPMGKRIRVGVIGAGRMGERHCRAYAALHGAELVGISDLAIERGQAIAAKYGATFYPDFAEMLPHVDAVSDRDPDRDCTSRSRSSA